MSVSVTLVRSLVEEIVRVGADAAKALAHAGIDGGLLDDPDARIELGPYERLQELTLDVTGDPALGLHMGDRASLSAFHVVGFLSIHCKTLRHALEAFVRYRSLLSEVGPGSLVEEGDRAILTCDFVRGCPRCSRLCAELVVTGLIRTARRSLGVWQPPLGVELEHPEPEYASEYEAILECPVRFGAPATQIHFSRSLLDAPHIHENTGLFQLLSSRADLSMASLGSPISSKVGALLVDLVREGERPVMPVVARRLGVSPRTLRRRLQEEGRTFADIADHAMADVARRLLHQPEHTIQEVADRLGFSEPSAFHRAFKRWTGLTPRQFRDRS
jgi:AraC-like DNA-binding protein